MKKLLLIAIATAIMFTIGSKVLADERDDEERKQPLQEVFQTELVYPQEKGEIQFTLTPQFNKGVPGEEDEDEDEDEAEGGEGKSDIWQIPFAIEYGITDAWQAELEWNTYVHRDPGVGLTTEGIGDLEIGTKYSFMNIGDSNFHAALGFEIGFPIADIDDELTEGFIEYEPFISLAMDFLELNYLQLFTQVGFGFVQRVKDPADPDDKEPAAHELNFNVGFFIPFGPIVFTSEFTWTTNEWNNDGEEDQKYFTPGLVWNLPGGWEVGVGAPIGLNDGADEYRIIAQVSYEFELFGDDD